MLAEPTASGDWQYVGRVGTGFSQATLKTLRARLESLEIKTCPLPTRPKDVPVRESRWVQPDMIVEIEFLKRSKEGVLRFPSFKGVREDITVSDLQRSAATDPESAS